jgi:hypothetical protein
MAHRFWQTSVGSFVTKGAAAILPLLQRSKPVKLADLCLTLGVLFAFGTLVLKIIEVARDR